MIPLLQTVHNTIQRHAGLLALLGLAGVGAYNWRLWQRDKQQVVRYLATCTQQPTLPATPKVSALVAAWNEQREIGAHIESFLALDYPNSELIICAGGKDDTLALAQRYASERVIVLEQQPGMGKQRALVQCMAHASGEIIYLTDADCRFDTAALVRLLAPLVAGEVAVTTGAIKPLPHQQTQIYPQYVWATDVASTIYRGTESRGLLGQNAAITRQAIEQMGGLDFPAPTGTDYQLARRLIAAGASIHFIPTSVVPADYAETLREYQRRQARWLRNLILYGRRYGVRSDVLVTARTMGVGTTMLLLPLAGLVLRATVLLPWLLLLTHAVASKLRYLGCLAAVYRRPISLRLVASLVPLTLIDFAIWALPIRDLLNPKRWEQW